MDGTRRSAPPAVGDPFRGVCAILVGTCVFVGGCAPLVSQDVRSPRAMRDACAHISAADWAGIVTEARELGPSDVDKLRAEQQAKPGEASLRVRLLASLAASDQTSEEYWAEPLGHLEWLVASCPSANVLAHPLVAKKVQVYASDAAQERVRLLWLRQVEQHPQNPRILANAASYLGFRPENKMQARSLLKRAIELDPRNRTYWLRLAQLFAEGTRTRGRPVAEVKDFVDKARAAYAEAMAPGLAPDEFEDWDLRSASFAAEYATIESRGDAWALKHYGKTLLGLLSLRKGAVRASRDLLLASVDEAPSAPPGFVPSLVLVEALLDSGERSAVVEYLTRCNELHQDQRYGEWVDAVERGDTPSLRGAQLP